MRIRARVRVRVRLRVRGGGWKQAHQAIEVVAALGGRLDDEVPPVEVRVLQRAWFGVRGGVRVLGF